MVDAQRRAIAEAEAAEPAEPTGAETHAAEGDVDKASTAPQIPSPPWAFLAGQIALLIGGGFVSS